MIGVRVYMPHIEYRHPGMVRESDPWAAPVLTTRTMAILPGGYANHSPRTSLTQNRV